MKLNDHDLNQQRIDQLKKSIDKLDAINLKLNRLDHFFFFFLKAAKKGQHHLFSIDFFLCCFKKHAYNR